MFSVNATDVYVEQVVGLYIQYHPEHVDHAVLQAIMHGRDNKIAYGTLEEMRQLKDTIRRAMIEHRFDTGYFDVPSGEWVPKRVTNQ